VRTILAMILSVYCGLASGFGATGHRVVGQIAENHLTDSARAGVQDLLGRESLAQVSTWADEIRSDDAWDHASTWHWVTIEDGETYDQSRKSDRGDVIARIRLFIRQLRDPDASRQDREIALRWLVHLIGDIHQPLHVGRGPDRGGNGIAAVWFGEPTNLHAIWDSKIIESTGLSYTELADFTDQATPAEIQIWQDAGVIDWANESIALRETVYTVPGNPYEYSYHNLPVVKQRLLQAGVRLARVLNETFR
jgi:hypothetical protein